MNRSMGNKILQSKKRREANGKAVYPKGFDITLADAISELNLNMDQIKKLGDLTQQRRIANASMGQQVYYRRTTLADMFPVVHVDESTVDYSGVQEDEAAHGQ